MHIDSTKALWCARDMAVSAGHTAGVACSGRRTGGRLSSAGPRVLRRSSSPAAPLNDMPACAHNMLEPGRLT